MSERPQIVPVGKVPELGNVPEKMHAFVIRPERFGEPKKSFVQEEMTSGRPARARSWCRSWPPA
jgi:crotonyl-CoA carboxylase/reductase